MTGMFEGFFGFEIFNSGIFFGWEHLASILAWIFGMGFWRG